MLGEDMTPLVDAAIAIKETCMKKYQEELTRPTQSGVFCPRIFDGWLCWPPTKAGKQAIQPCPKFIEGFNTINEAVKACTDNGSWYWLQTPDKSWSNYTQCANVDKQNVHEQVTLLSELGYSISLTALLLSILILTYFRSLRCARITLHINLFVSFAMNCTLWLIYYATVPHNTEAINRSEIWCQGLHIVLHYFLLSNYSWMLCEGLYLHTVLVAAFFSEAKLLWALRFVGWGAPLVVILVYTCARLSSPEHTKRCLMDDSPYKAILKYPIVISIVLNLLFLINIVRVLIVKLKAGPHVQQAGAPSRAALQAFRATLLLVPLLGLHHMLTPFKPARGSPYENYYVIITSLTVSFQGLCVAILFCFCNGEVISQVKRKWRTIMFRPRANSCTATTVSCIRSTPYPLTGEEKV